MIDLKRPEWGNGETEIGYWAVPASRAQGVMTEATVALSRWVLTEVAFERVVLRIATGNEASTGIRGHGSATVPGPGWFRQ